MGANSDTACRNVFPNMQPVPCPTFEDAFDALKSGDTDLAMIPIENTLAGRVADIHFDTHTYRAVVVISMNDGFEFPKDTIATILTSGLLGEQYVGLEAGGDEAMLKDGDRIRITQSAVVLEKLIGQFLFSKASETPAGGAGAK